MSVYEPGGPVAPAPDYLAPGTSLGFHGFRHGLNVCDASAWQHEHLCHCTLSPSLSGAYHHRFASSPRASCCTSGHASNQTIRHTTVLTHRLRGPSRLQPGREAMKALSHLFSLTCHWAKPALRGRYCAMTRIKATGCPLPLPSLARCRTR